MRGEAKVAAGVFLTLLFGALVAVLMACTANMDEASGAAQQCIAACAPARGTIVLVGYGQCVCAPMPCGSYGRRVRNWRGCVIREVTMAEGNKLYEVEHSYYCNNNFYSNEPKRSFASWADFVDEELGDIDDDYNFLFRWDWRRYESDDDRVKAFDVGEQPDTGPTDEYLELFYMGQRKGLFRVVRVYNMSKDDDIAVRQFLRARWQYMVALWAPVSGER